MKTRTGVILLILTLIGCDLEDSTLPEEIDDHDFVSQTGMAYPSLAKGMCSLPRLVVLIGQSNAVQIRDEESWPRAMDSLASWTGDTIHWLKWARGGSGLIPGTSKGAYKDWYIDNPVTDASYTAFRQELDDIASGYPDSPIHIFWIQGGRDIQMFDNGYDVTEDEYFTELSKLVNDLSEDYLVDFWIVQEAHRLMRRNGKTGPQQDSEGARTIRNAQQRVANALPNVRIAFRQVRIRAEDSSQWNGDKYEYHYSADAWHYNTAGYDFMNQTAVLSLANFLATGNHEDPPYPEGY